MRPDHTPPTPTHTGRKHGFRGVGADHGGVDRPRVAIPQALLARGMQEVLHAGTVPCASFLVRPAHGGPPLRVQGDAQPVDGARAATWLPCRRRSRRSEFGFARKPRSLTILSLAQNPIQQT